MNDERQISPVAPLMRWLHQLCIANCRSLRVHALRILIGLILVSLPCSAQEPAGLEKKTPPKQVDAAARRRALFQDQLASIKAVNKKAEGYQGIWYATQKTEDMYVYKYSGGLGTYSAKHQPFAIYSPVVNKTFFCYGGALEGSSRRLGHMVSYFDHATKKVPRPTILIDKRTSDAHDNPVISIDDQGFIWIFSNSHGRERPSFVHRSNEPYSVERFERVTATYLHRGRAKPLDNFSYMQLWPRKPAGFVAFFTRYRNPASRTLMFMSSEDGVQWSKWQRLAAIEKGHYQVSATQGQRAASAFNYHPQEKGLNYRTNLYYVESTDGGRTWQDVSGKQLELPLTDVQNTALVRDYASLDKIVYMKDIQFDHAGRPLILILTSAGYQAGPGNDPRTWTLVRWTGNGWKFSDITTSDSNYDMGSIYLGEKAWHLIAPTEPGPQPYNPGGEMCLWRSEDQGASWHRQRVLTQQSNYNHTYARRPVDAHPDFYAFWADGHGRKPSESRFYFCNQRGDVYQLPPQMETDYATPLLLPEFSVRE